MAGDILDGMTGSDRTRIQHTRWAMERRKCIYLRTMGGNKEIELHTYNTGRRFKPVGDEPSLLTKCTVKLCFTAQTPRRLSPDSGRSRDPGCSRGLQWGPLSSRRVTRGLQRCPAAPLASPPAPAPRWPHTRPCCCPGACSPPGLLTS